MIIVMNNKCIYKTNRYRMCAWVANWKTRQIDKVARQIGKLFQYAYTFSKNLVFNLPTTHTLIKKKNTLNRKYFPRNNKTNTTTKQKKENDKFPQQSKCTTIYPESAKNATRILQVTQLLLSLSLSSHQTYLLTGLDYKNPAYFGLRAQTHSFRSIQFSSS